MGTRARKDHDNAWGLNFGDPRKTRVVPQKKGWFGKGNAELEEHPMSVAMATSLEEELAKNPLFCMIKTKKAGPSSITNRWREARRPLRYFSNAVPTPT